MKPLIAILIVLAVIFAGWKVWEYWDTVEKEKDIAAQKAARPKITGDQLEGVPRQLENSLRKAQEEGPKSLKAWLDIYKNTSVKDPRLAWIELDYVLMVSRDNPAEAKRVFAEVKKRITSDSPVYPRVKELEKTYE